MLHTPASSSLIHLVFTCFLISWVCSSLLVLRCFVYHGPKRNRLQYSYILHSVGKWSANHVGWCTYNLMMFVQRFSELGLLLTTHNCTWFKIADGEALKPDLQKNLQILWRFFMEKWMRLKDTTERLGAMEKDTNIKQIMAQLRDWQKVYVLIPQGECNFYWLKMHI